MAVIRRYKKGDIDDMELNEFGLMDWRADKSEPVNEDAWVVEVGKYKCIVCIEPQEDCGFYFWFSPDRRISPIYIKWVKIILDWVLETKGFAWSLSYEGKNQDKMHEFLGATKTKVLTVGNERRVLWVRV